LLDLIIREILDYDAPRAKVLLDTSNIVSSIGDSSNRDGAGRCAIYSLLLEVVE
jgi:hypothetical protein